MRAQNRGENPQGIMALFEEMYLEIALRKIFDLFFGDQNIVDRRRFF